MTLAEKLRKEGRKEGREEGQQRILLKLLGLRFGEVPGAVAARIESADVSELELWAERVLIAPTIDDVLKHEG